MFTAYLVVAATTIVLNGAAAVADFWRAEFVLANAAAVGVPPSWVPPLGALKAAGAAGLLLGLFGVAVIGSVAAAGLVLFFVGAVAAHVRAHAYRKIIFPGSYLALAVASLVLSVTTSA